MILTNNIYRSFNPQSNKTQKELFDAQVSAISNLVTPSAINMGDYNLDYKKGLDINNSHKNYFTVLDTWLRVINNVVHSLLLEYIDVNNPGKKIAFGDHQLLTFTINYKYSIPHNLFKRV